TQLHHPQISQVQRPPEGGIQTKQTQATYACSLFCKDLSNRCHPRSSKPLQIYDHTSCTKSVRAEISVTPRSNLSSPLVRGIPLLKTCLCRAEQARHLARTSVLDLDRLVAERARQLGILTKLVPCRR